MLSADQLESFDKDGYLILPSLFTPQEVSEIMMEIEKLQKIADSRFETFDSEGTRFVKNGKQIQRIVWCPGVSPRLLRFCQDPKLLGPISQILGSRDLVQLISQAHFKLPGDGVSFPWHQDSEHRKYGTSSWNDINGNGSFVQSIMALDPMTRDNGPIRIIPNSANDGHLYLERGTLHRSSFDQRKILTPELSPGSVLLFGPFTVHGSQENRSKTARRVFINGFTIPGVNFFEYPGCGLGLPTRFNGILHSKGNPIP
ncbi:MAG: phytanoyl-CoA dioxygenase family protein [Pseudobacteriovorax sp.]|nr:phytanoyl-CoA dioxygenase family protein [Pseudobacteriovorax sp.]